MRFALIPLFAILVAGCGAPSAEPSAGDTSALATDAGAAFTVAYIGDSHSDYEGNARGSFGFLGQHTKELMAADAIAFSLFAASGSSPAWWHDTTSSQAATWGYTQTASNPARKTCSRGSKTGTCVPKLGVVLKDHPNLLVIEQGTNMLGMGATSITHQIATTLAEIDGKVDACLWVGAPNARTSVHSAASQDQLWQLVHDGAGPKCFTFDSRFEPALDADGHVTFDDHGTAAPGAALPYSPDANDDGEHLGMTAAGAWAAGVAKAIEAIEAISPRTSAPPP